MILMANLSPKQMCANDPMPSSYPPSPTVAGSSNSMAATSVKVHVDVIAAPLP